MYKKTAFLEVMEVSNHQREHEKQQIKRDAQRFEEYTRNNVAQALAKAVSKCGS